jgi:mono-ADP-ribosyltransferase sirtuin 6
VPEQLISFLYRHGNVFKEYCEKCLKEFHRDYCVDLFSTDCHKEPWYVRCPDCKWNHYTGRLCDCGGKLRDTIVNFGDNLFTNGVCGGLPRARKESKRADVMLALGSSLTVPPANGLVTRARRLVVCNLQATEFDAQCAVRLFATCDAVMTLLASELQRKQPSEPTRKRPIESRVLRSATKKIQQ